jgi:hypothetical protein
MPLTDVPPLRFAIEDIVCSAESKSRTDVRGEGRGVANYRRALRNVQGAVLAHDSRAGQPGTPSLNRGGEGLIEAEVYLKCAS